MRNPGSSARLAAGGGEGGANHEREGNERADSAEAGDAGALALVVGPGDEAERDHD